MEFKRIAICCLALLLGACDKYTGNTGAIAAAAPKPVPLTIDISSPDRAVKSWWNFRDVVASESHRKCLERENDPPKGAVTSVSKVAYEAVLRQYQAFMAMKCPPLSQYSREIQEVKVETETRAVVYALVKDVTLIPTGAVPSENDKEWRVKGSRGKYLLEKTEGGWKVAQVYEFDTYKSDGTGPGWTEVYTQTIESPPRYPSLVSGSDL